MFIYVKMIGVWIGYFWELKERSLFEDFVWYGFSLYIIFIDECVVGVCDFG